MKFSSLAPTLLLTHFLLEASTAEPFPEIDSATAEQPQFVTLQSTSSFAEPIVVQEAQQDSAVPLHQLSTEPLASAHVIDAVGNTHQHYQVFVDGIPVLGMQEAAHGIAISGVGEALGLGQEDNETK
jgi:hypothetical protein